jgi:GT2 family glycosyltransferase
MCNGFRPNPRLGVVIVNYNGAGYIERCLFSLQESASASPLVVVDNGSTDGSPEAIAAHFPGITLIRRENDGFAGGVNAGLNRCLDHGCDAAVLLNPDTVVQPDTIEAFIRAMRRHPDAILSPAIFYLSNPDLSDSYAGRMQWWRGRMKSAFLGRSAGELPRSDVLIETASFCAVLIPANVFRRVGPLDDRYFLYFEDADYLERAHAAGCQLWYVPDVRVLHSEGKATGGATSPLALYYYVRNRHLLVRKFRRDRPVYMVFTIFAALDALRRPLATLVRGRPSLALAALRGSIDGFMSRTGRAAEY